MAKSKIAIVTDSTAYIPKKFIDEHKIHVIPLHLNWGEDTLKDGVDISPDDFYDRLEISEENPFTSQPSAGEFESFYQKILKEHNSIISIHISNELSGTVNSAQSASSTFNQRIDIVDSRSTSMGLGFIVIAAAEAIAKGESHSHVLKQTQNLVKKTRLMFAVDTLKYLHRGGRIGGAKKLMGTMLSIKPILHLENGVIEPLASVRTKGKAISKLLEIMEKEIGENKLARVAVINAKASQDASKLEVAIKTQFDPIELFNVELSPVIGTHVGPGTVGIAFLLVD